MVNVYLQNTTVPRIAFAVLAVVLITHLIRSFRKSPQAWCLAGYIFFVLMTNCAYVLRDILPNPAIRLAYPFMQAIIMGMVLLLLFGLLFPEDKLSKSGRTLVLIYGVAVLVVYLTYLFGDFPQQQFSFQFNHENFYPRSGPLDKSLRTYNELAYLLLIDFGYVATIITLLGKAAKSSQKSGSFVARLLDNTGKTSRTAHAYALATFVSFLASATFLLEDVGLVPVRVYHFAFTYGSLLTILLYYIIFVNYSGEFSSFRQKIITVTLSLVLVIVGILSNLLVNAALREYDSSKIALSDEGYTAYLTAADPEVYSFAQYVIVRHGDSEINPYTAQGIDVGRLDDSKLHLVSGWSESSPRAGVHIQKGFRALSTDNLKSFYVSYLFVRGNTQVEFGFPYTELRASTNGSGFVLIVGVLVAGAAILFLFPWFFKSGITAPLDELYRGVITVGKGDLDVVVPVHYADEIGHIAGAFNKMVRSVKTADRLKDEFLSNTSHELRTPLNGIIGIAESLVDGATGQLPDATNRNLSLLIASGRRLTSLVDDILDYSKLRVGEVILQKKPVDINELIEVVVSLSAPLVQDKAVKLVTHLDPSVPAVVGDENRLQQILYNLIGNAVKFTPSGTVTVGTMARDAGDGDRSVEVSVADTGIGIPADKLGVIFRSFEQADASTAREYGGTGLGLSITKRLVELHGGELKVSSTEGVGSVFSFTVPATDEIALGLHVRKDRVSAVAVPVEESLLSSNQISSSGAASILIVDDEPINLQVLDNHLSMADYRTVRAKDGFEAIEKLGGGDRPDLVLLDVMMPGMNGYETCRKIRESCPSNELPIIMLTAKNQVSDLVDGFSSGANDYIAKPFSKNELLTRIKTHLHLAKLTQSYGRFVPTEFLDILGKDSILDVRLGDQIQREMTIMFSDIRSFTTISEKMAPTENFDFINHYLGKIVPHIRSQSGFVDKYLGDGIMALFPRSPENAIGAAVLMQNEVERFSGELRPHSGQEVRIGIGLHTGNLIVGTVGEINRMDETVISDAVNLASRIEGLTKLYNASILVSEQTLTAAADGSRFASRFLGRVQVKGKHQSVRVHEILDGDRKDIRSLKEECKSDFDEGLDLYYKRQFAEASVLLNSVLKKNRFDRAAALYLERAAGFIAHEPPPDWDGVEHLETK